MHKEYTQRFWSNCWITGLWLWLLGYVDRLVLLSADSGPIPHLAGITRRGHLLAFGYGCHPEAKAYLLYPYWFEGQIRGCQRKYLKRVFGSRLVLGHF